MLADSATLQATVVVQATTSSRRHRSTRAALGPHVAIVSAMAMGRTRPQVGRGPQSAKNGAAKSVRSVPPRWSAAPHAAVPARATVTATRDQATTVRRGATGGGGAAVRRDRGGTTGLARHDATLARRGVSTEVCRRRTRSMSATALAVPRTVPVTFERPSRGA